MSWMTLGLGLAGGLGVLARQLVQRAVPRTASLPWGTFLVNVSGALALGLLLTLLTRRWGAPDWVHEVLFIGFLGGYTTFSALSAETLLLFEQGRVGTAVAYALGSLVCGVLAVFAGMSVGRLLA